MGKKLLKIKFSLESFRLKTMMNEQIDKLLPFIKHPMWIYDPKIKTRTTLIHWY